MGGTETQQKHEAYEAHCEGGRTWDLGQTWLEIPKDPSPSIESSMATCKHFSEPSSKPQKNRRQSESERFLCASSPSGASTIGAKKPRPVSATEAPGSPEPAPIHLAVSKGQKPMED